MNQSNYFKLFNLKTALPVDEKKLSEQYRLLQKKYHPDNFTDSSNDDKIQIISQSALINEAYKTLNDQTKAAEYLLKIKGIAIDAEQDTIRDLDFLNEQFELREKLEDVIELHDASKLEEFFVKINTKQQQIHKTLLEQINNENYDLAKKSLYKLKYFFRLLEQIESIQENMAY